MTYKTTTVTVQKWGNSLAVRIPAAMARSADFHLGTLVEIEAHDGTVLIKATGRRKLTLNERLAAFDLEKHGGETMVVQPIGLEKF
ncbi:MAG: AbrB/MazE/SpoVT family DNA-binding domain-containing protein [Tatlockia sp.]|nr:AbrB/MazE/SpoVT family DNA-binding domain-containing protein [Tatlockia sp.]